MIVVREHGYIMRVEQRSQLKYIIICPEYNNSDTSSDK